MGAFPNPNVGPPGGMAGGVPQYFSSSDPHSFFPGAPQYNLAMSRMMGDFGSNDADLSSLLGAFGPYGAQIQKQALAKGVMDTTNTQDALAKQFASGQRNPEDAQGIQSGSEIGSQAEYGAKMLGTTVEKAKARRAMSDVPGQMELQKQAIANAYRQNQIKRLSTMISTAANAAGSQFGYQSAQLAADHGQIALDNAQNQEQTANMQSMMHMLFGNNLPSLFGQGSMSAFGPMGQGGGFLSSYLNSGGGAGGSAPDALFDPGQSAYLSTVGMQA